MLIIRLFRRLILCKLGMFAKESSSKIGNSLPSSPIYLNFVRFANAFGPISTILLFVRYISVNADRSTNARAGMLEISLSSKYNCFTVLGISGIDERLLFLQLTTVALL